MIRGDKSVAIKRYLFIDRCAEGVGWTMPEPGEEFVGCPFGWCDDLSAPFIEHRRDGKVTRSVNCSDVAIIDFDNTAPIGGKELEGK